MSTTVCYNKESRNSKLGNLRYGTMFTDAPNCPNSFYIKIDKHNLGAGIKLYFPAGSSLALNIKTGAIRAISGDAHVTVLDCECNVTKADFSGSLRDNYFK